MHVEATVPTLSSFQVLLFEGEQPRVLAELASQEMVCLSLSSFFTTPSLGRALHVPDSESQTNSRMLCGSVAARKGQTLTAQQPESFSLSTI